jgi:hypothetical protein
MVTKCGLIFDLLQAAFTGFVTEHEYHLTVHCLREYAAERDCRDLEQQAAISRGWRADYDPCEHMERIRYGMTFGTTCNTSVMDAVNAWNDRNNQGLPIAC